MVLFILLDYYNIPAIVDLVDQQSKPSIRHIVTAVSPKYHILLTVVHLPFKIAISVTPLMDRINIWPRERSIEGNPLLTTTGYFPSSRLHL
jgi:hypothetical protein